MSEGPTTYRDHLLSIYQSAAAEIGRRQATSPPAALPSRTMRTRTRSVAAGSQETIEDAAAKVAGRRFTSVDGDKAQPRMRSTTMVGSVRSCAELGLRYLEAKIGGDHAAIARIEADFKTGTCDPAWATTLNEYLRFFGANGMRREIAYVRPAQAGEGVIEIKADAKIALVSDWGTGAEPAARVLRQIAALKPDIFIHLGDIYYSGTPVECDVNFSRLIDETLGTSRDRLPVYVLAGNHDMYCGGVGFYDLIGRLNPPTRRQCSSYFCLRSADERWQLLAMDTGLHDYSPLQVQSTVTHLEEEEVDWHLRRIREFKGKTILLSHHPLFSAFSPINAAGPDGARSAHNGNLLSAYRSIAAEGDIACWFWGHEHSLAIYAPFDGLERGRCIGHGGVPVFTSEDIYAPVKGLVHTPAVLEGTKLSQDGSVWAHGFAFLRLGQAGATQAEYFQDVAGEASLVFRETLG
jgi:hypothetical protein